MGRESGHALGGRTAGRPIRHQGRPDRWNGTRCVIGLLFGVIEARTEGGIVFQAVGFVVLITLISMAASAAICWVRKK